MGISPKDIKVILDKKDNSTLLEFLKSQGDYVDIKIEELQRSRDVIKMVRNNISLSLASVSNNKPFYKNIPSRNVITVKLETINEDILLCYSRLYQLVDRLKLTSTYETGIIYSADGESAFYPAEVLTLSLRIPAKVKKILQSYLPADTSVYALICKTQRSSNVSLISIWRRISLIRS